MSIRKGKTIIAGSASSIDWTGTLEEYNIALENGTIQPNWICYITDDILYTDDIRPEIDRLDNVKANKDLSNLTETGEKHFLNKQQITNCLLEVPQRIKLELNNGTLTLKAGSQVIVPNGFEADGVTPKFDYVTIESDLTDIADTQRQAMIWCEKSGENYFITAPMPLAYCYSGSIAPSSFYADSLALWYDTSTNFVKYTTNSGATWDNQGHSLPFAIVTETTTSYSSIDQIFNGMGFIGKHRWVDKGIKYLLPKGRNEDGTLRNIEAVTTNIQVMDGSTKTSKHVFLTPNSSFDYGAQYYEQEEEPTVTGSHTLWFNPKENIIYSTTDGAVTWYILTCAYAGKLEKLTTDGNFTNINIKQPFRAVDYSDKPQISGWGMPSNNYIDLELGASGTTYTAPANGYVCIAFVGNTSGILHIYVNKTPRYGLSVPFNNGAWTEAMIPVQRGELIAIQYSGTPTVQYFNFIYAEGEK